MTMTLRFFLFLLLGGLVLPGCSSSTSTAAKDKGETPDGGTAAVTEAGEDEKDVPALIVALQDQNPVTRRTAAMNLGEKGADAADAAEPLKTLLADTDVTVQRAAARALVKIVGAAATDAIPVLVEMLKDQKNPLNRREAARSLGLLGAAARETALEPLTAMLADADVKTRVNAAVAITQMANGEVAEAMPVLLDALTKEKNALNRSELGWAISEYGAAAADAVAPLTELLQENDATVKRTAAYAIVRIAGAEAKDAVTVLVEALKDEDPQQRLIFVEVLRSFGSGLAEAAVPALTEALQDQTIEVRRLAALSLVVVAKEQAAPAVPVLTEALTDMEVGTRYLATRALGELGALSAEAVPSLTQLLKDADDNVRRASAVALVQVQGKEATEALPILIESLGSEDQETRYLAAFSLVTFGPMAKDALPALNKMLQEESLDSRRTAAMVLLHVDGPDSKGAVTVLGEALKDQDVMTRLAYAQTLGDTGKHAVGLLPALRETLKDEDLTVKRAAAVAMTQIAPKEAGDAVKVLAHILTDMDAGTREMGASILGTLGPVAKEAIGDLTKALQDAEVSVRRTAAIALLKVEGAESKGAIEVLSAALADPDPQVRETWAWELSTHGTLAEGTAPALTKLLKDETVSVQRASAYALAKIQGWNQAKPAMAVLLAALGDPDPVTRAVFVQVLNNFTGPAPAEVIEALQKAAKDNDETVRTGAEGLLKKLQKD